MFTCNGQHRSFLTNVFIGSRWCLTYKTSSMPNTQSTHLRSN